MVSDILLYKKLLEDKKKALIILPFVSVTQEKMLSLKYVLKSIGVRVDAFAGGVNPRGGLARVDVAVCTIEKANNMLNRSVKSLIINECLIYFGKKINYYYSDLESLCLIQLNYFYLFYLKNID